MLNHSSISIITVLLSSGIMLIDFSGIAVITLPSPNRPSLVWPPLALFPAVLSFRSLLIASVVESLVTRLHGTLQQTLDTYSPFTNE